MEPQEIVESDEEIYSQDEGYQDEDIGLYQEISTIDILKDRRMLEERNEEYLNGEFEWDDRALAALQVTFGLEKFRTN